MTGMAARLVDHKTVNVESVFFNEQALEGLRHFVAGSMGGFVCKSLEYPLDTVKVVLQTQQGGGRLRAIDCFRSIIQDKGPAGLYKGLLSPLLGCMAENATLFTAFGFARTALATHHTPWKENPAGAILAGGVAGVAVTFVLTPVELIKCRLQVQSRPGQPQLYKGPWDCIMQTLHKEGLRKGLYQGSLATLFRELPGNMAWFGVYESLCLAMMPKGGSRDDLKTHQLMFAGGVSGAAYWTAFYPADTVKSVMQTDPVRNARGFFGVFRDLWAEDGMRALFRGWGITASRALISNALLFLTYERVDKMLRARR